MSQLDNFQFNMQRYNDRASLVAANSIDAIVFSDGRIQRPAVGLRPPQPSVDYWKRQQEVVIGGNPNR